MYPSLSGLDAVEAHRQELLAEACREHNRNAATTMQAATGMWALVNASYGIAMGQRPGSGEPPAARRATTRSRRTPRYPSQQKAVLARFVGHVLRSMAAAVTRRGQLRALTRSEAWREQTRSANTLAKERHGHLEEGYMPNPN